MSRRGDTQTRIVAALKSLPALSGVNVRPCANAFDAFVLNLSKQPEIFVAFVRGARTGPGVANTRKQMGRDWWAICVVSTSFENPSAAQSQINGTFELCEACHEVQMIDIGVPGGKNEFLMWLTDTPNEAPGRSVTGGGSFGYISEYEAPQRLM